MTQFQGGCHCQPGSTRHRVAYKFVVTKAQHWLIADRDLAFGTAMSAINITSVTVLDNPTLFQNPLQLEIQYECLYPLEHGEAELLDSKQLLGSYML